MTSTIIVVEDEAIIAMSLQDMLEEFGYHVPTVAATAHEALTAITQFQPDLLLLDIHLAGGDDGITLAETVQNSFDLPVVFLTAHSDQATFIRARATRPAHFLLKPFHERELQIAIDLALLQHRSEQQLRASEQRFATTLRSIAEGVIVTDSVHQITYLNPAAAQITGWPAPEALGQPLDTVVQAITAGGPISTLTAQAISLGEALVLPDDAILTRRDGLQRRISDSVAPLTDDRGHVGGAVLVLQDVTDQRQAAEAHQQIERKLLETQRLESLGILAGGIAHDFNNLLAFILGYIELAQTEVPPANPAAYYLGEAVSGVQQAANLIAQLLAYSGKGRFQIRLIDMNRLVAELHTLIRASIGRVIPIALHLDSAQLPVRADATQLHQVVLNLLTNAAEAMEGRDGTITVSTGTETLSAQALEGCLIGADLPPGRYVFVRVRDMGCGMDDATRMRIFDPFFTTKFTGRGLGLAAVRGILSGHQAALHVLSTPGVGSTFSVFLPLAEALGATVAVGALPPHHQGSIEPATAPAPMGTLLVIDDEPNVRAVTARMLEHMGFTVIAAPDGPAGIMLLERGLTNLSGVILDLTMPGMSGEAVAHRIQELRPDTPIILMSGYSAEEVARNYQGPGLQCFLQKPFTRDALRTALRSILATGAHPATRCEE